MLLGLHFLKIKEEAMQKAEQIQQYVTENIIKKKKKREEKIKLLQNDELA